MQLALHLQPAHSGFCAAVSHFCTLGAEERDAQTRTDTPDGDVEGVNADNFAYKKLNNLQICKNLQPSVFIFPIEKEIIIQ
jgi:hypothetical protein